MIVASIVFHYHCMTVKDIDPYVAAGIVAMGIVEGAKTAPPPFGTPKTPTLKNNRLVLGEQNAATKEAREKGGAFIEIPSAVLKTLQQGNIDPYMIYEKGLLNQIEAGIPRIDFVEANVDELFNEWKARPQSQAPIYVRLIVWLKNNAETVG
jgi:hypothetical protein